MRDPLFSQKINKYGYKKVGFNVHSKSEVAAINYGFSLEVGFIGIL